MYIKRIGKSLESCSHGFFYKVVGTDKTRFFISDNNGDIIPVRQSSKHWDSNCEVDMTRVGSLFTSPTGRMGNTKPQLQNIKPPQQPNQSNTEIDTIMYANMALLLLD